MGPHATPGAHRRGLQVRPPVVTPRGALRPFDPAGGSAPLAPRGVRGDPDHPANRGRLCTKGSTLHLSATREILATLALLLAFILAPILADSIGYIWMGAIMGAFVALGYLVSMVGVREDLSNIKDDSVGMLSSLKIVLSSVPFRWYLGANMAKEYIWLVLAASLPFWRKYALGIVSKGQVFGASLGAGEVGRLVRASRVDALLFPAARAEVHLLPGVDERALHEARARFHKRPGHDGRVCLVLGAGNINSIPPLDVATRLFQEGQACLLKLNPVNAYLGPILQEAFAEAIARGVLEIVQGGAEEGAYLAHHPAVNEVHMTGSIRTHDAVVWGPPGPEREARRARGEPLFSSC